jgi:hypothetical protein
MPLDAIYSRTEGSCSVATTRDILDQVSVARFAHVERHGYSAAHDDALPHGALTRTAISYALASADDLPEARRFHMRGDRATPVRDECDAGRRDRRGLLIHAAALLIAEIEKIDRNGDNRTSSGRRPPV